MYLLQHYIEKSVSRFPEKIAVRSGKQAISYKTLWEQANRLANQLLTIGFEPKNPVGIYMHKSIEAIISMFAVLKAGGIYIPLDSQYSPKSRIKNILRLSETKFLITNRKQWTELISGLSENEIELRNNMSVIFTDNLLSEENEQKSLFREYDSNLFYFDHSMPDELLTEENITDNDLAYILYTSGSTGIPKGVMLSHRNAITFIDWAISCFKPVESDIFSNVAPLHFDLSVFDIYVSLACGAEVELVPNHVSANPRAMLEWIAGSRITYFYSVPSVWTSILNYADLKGDLPYLSKILFAGEVFPPKQLKRLMELIPNASFYNLYGPTETNVCTYHHIKNSAEISDMPVPIGMACANTEVVVLKNDDKPASIGEEGELFVKGSIVTSGYYKNPECTKNAFRKSPLPFHNNSLLYKTGDIVRVIGPGTFQYIGRKDLMVKYSGFRIELQEIEAALLKHESVNEAIVVPIYYNGNSSASSITAFVTVKPGSLLRIIELKEFLAGILPRYMIPETINLISEMPKNSNGKSDRKKLTEQAITEAIFSAA